MAKQEVAGIPWRDWIPDFKLPTTCQVDGCHDRVTRALYYTAMMTYFDQGLKFTQHVFCCGKHGDELEKLVIRLRVYGPSNI